MTHCLNCNQGVEGNFCSQCGQKASTHRFSVPHVMHEIPHSLFHIDKGIFKNITSIMYTRRAVQEYMAGRRLSYFNPFLYFLSYCGILILPLFLIAPGYDLGYQCSLLERKGL